MIVISVGVVLELGVSVHVCLNCDQTEDMSFSSLAPPNPKEIRAKTGVTLWLSRPRDVWAASLTNKMLIRAQIVERYQKIEKALLEEVNALFCSVDHGKALRTFDGVFLMS